MEIGSHPRIEYLNDQSVNAEQDRQLRYLLSMCFTKPEDTAFRQRRYLLELPQHRWIIQDSSGGIIAHVMVQRR